jgi:hypothetical protein
VSDEVLLECAPCSFYTLIINSSESN